MAHDHGSPGRVPSARSHSAHDHAGHEHHGHDHDAHDHGVHDHGVHDHGAHDHDEHDLDELDWDDDPGGELDDEWDDEDWDDEDDEEEEVDLKEAFGLPDVLPPMRLPSEAELAATARAIPLLAELAALADWVGPGGRAVSADAELSDADQAEAVAALGVPAERFAFLWKYAGAVDWIEESTPGRVTRGETADEWADGEDGDDGEDGEDGALNAWSATFAAVLTEAMCVAAAGPGRPDVDFHAPGAPLALLLFMARREGLTAEEVTELVAEVLTEDEPARVQRAWAAYAKANGDPAAVLLEQLTELGAITPPSLEEDGAIRLTPLALREMRDQFIDAGVDIPLLPDDPAEVTARELLAMADGAPDDEFEAETAAWLATRAPGDAASELLDVAAVGDPVSRLLAVAIVTAIGAEAEPAWRRHLGRLPMRPYAKATLVQLGGLMDAGEIPAELAPDQDDVSWMATDLLSTVCDDEDTDGEELADAFAGAMPPDGNAAAFLDLLSRGPHPDAVDVLEHVSEYHPDKAIAKEAKRTLYKASQRSAASAPRSNAPRSNAPRSK